METTLRIIQISLALFLTLIILLQSSNAELGGAFGGSGEVVQHTRRGLERILHRLTIVLAIIFIIVSIFSFIFTG